MGRAEILQDNIPLLKELGAENLFQPNLIYSFGVNQWWETVPIALEDNYHLVCVDLQTQPYREIHNYSGAFLFQGNPEQATQIPIGYATYPWINGPYAEMEQNPFNNVSMNPISFDNLNPSVLEIIKHSSRLLGMQIFEPYRHQGLGKMLFLLGAAYLQLNGCTKLRIINDGTTQIHENGITKSFYTHLGAKEVGNIGAKDFNLEELLTTYEENIHYYLKGFNPNPKFQAAHQLRIFE